MPLHIRNPQAETLANELAKLSGLSKSDAVIDALKDRVQRLRRDRAHRGLADELQKIALHCSSLPVLDSRIDDEILGYDSLGLPR